MNYWFLLFLALACCMVEAANPTSLHVRFRKIVCVMKNLSVHLRRFKVEGLGLPFHPPLMFLLYLNCLRWQLENQQVQTDFALQFEEGWLHNSSSFLGNAFSSRLLDYWEVMSLVVGHFVNSCPVILLYAWVKLWLF